MKPVRRHLTGGDLLSFDCDAAGNVDTITDPLGGITTITYDAANRPDVRTLPNGVTTDWDYDVRDH